MRIPPVAALLACGICCGCAAPQQQPAAVCPPAIVRGVIFAIDGAGGYESLSTSLRQVIAEQRLPYYVETVDWSHGRGRFLADQLDSGHAIEEGRHLAERIAAYRQNSPCTQTFVVAHSAGSLVALTAVEAAPPGSIDRLILLAPAVSSEYDLRPALCNVRQGIDVFRSYRDQWYLGIGAYIVGTTDRRWEAAAGRIGFQPILCQPCDSALYQKLHDHPWDPTVAWTGNEGGHTDSYKPGYLRAYVVPLLGESACKAAYPQ
jgi:pimeloyl-ACP methyl ester carboxylesterase